MKSVGNNIKKCRVALGLSQADVAKLLKISTPAFCKIETGQTDLNISRLLQIAKEFEVSMIQLITGEKESSNSSEDLINLKEQLLEKDEEINKLRKKVIDLYDKLGM
ncbi:MAG: XRE family transcriptional regulator [Pedobacter sp.]|nr:MAG: XRE family transcriptional regulator [Pedobacter sp.]